MSARGRSTLAAPALVLALVLGALPAGAGQPPADESAQPGPMELFRAYSRAQLMTTGFERREATVDGRRTVWWQKGDGPTLVLVHGVADQAGTWYRIAPVLAERRRVLLIDLPGHGESAPADGALAMSTVVAGFTTWLGDVATAGEGGPATLVGNSMGAWVALLAARHRPELVARVVMTNGGPLRADTGELDLLPADREEARRLMAALRDPSSPPTPDPVLDDLVRRVAGGEVERMFQAADDLDSHHLDAEGLSTLATPVDILWGESDRYLGRAYPERLRAALPRARLTWVATCGHLPQAECPERYRDLLLEVLDRPPAGPAAD